jgi:arylsulfatase A-like enzyme
MHGSVDENEELYLSEVTMAEELKSAGYRTNLVGKWHLGMSSLARTPTYRGFDHFYGNLGDQTDYWRKTNSDVLLDLHNDADLETDVTALDAEAHSEFVYAAEAVRVIHDHAENHAKDPMFLYFASQLMQAPHEALASYIALCADNDATSEQQAYCAMNLMLDKVVTKVVCALESTKMMDNTVFVMMSDNGGATEGSNYPFRGGKGSLFRGAHSVPAFIVAPSSMIPSSRVGGTYDGQMHVTGVIYFHKTNVTFFTTFLFI